MAAGKRRHLVGAHSREIGGRYVIEPRYQDGDTEIFDIYRLKRNGPNMWKSSRVGSTLSLDTAKAVAQKNYERLRVANNHEQSIDEKKIF
jgi:hypothetical protein